MSHSHLSLRAAKWLEHMKLAISLSPSFIHTAQSMHSCASCDRFAGVSLIDFLPCAVLVSKKPGVGVGLPTGCHASL